MKLKHLILAAVCGLFISFKYIHKVEPADAVKVESAQSLFPLQLKSIAGQTKSANKTLVLMTAKNFNKPVQTCGIKFKFSNGAYIGTLVPLTASSTVADFTYQLDTMQGFSNDSTVLLKLPTLQSGRAMISINNILCMSTVRDTSGFVFQEPNINNPGDPSYNILFDKFEFTYNQDGDFYINPTAVDFFGIPIHMNTLNDSLHSGSPLAIERSLLMDSIENVLTSLDMTTGHDWDTCIIHNPATNNLLRIASPSLAPGFDTSYLTTSSNGFDYIQNLSEYYIGKTLIIDCTQLDVAGDQIFDQYNQSPVQDPGAYYFTGTVQSKGNKFQFSNNPTSGTPITQTILMNEVTSQDFFAPGTGQFSTPNKSVQSIISENITSGFSVGLLPAMDGDTFSNQLFPKLMDSYFKSNPLNGPKSVGNGPWYNLYSQAIHNVLGDAIYAFAFDDVLGMDGTLVTTNKNTILVTIGDLGDINVPSQSCAPDVLTIDSSTISVSEIFCSGGECNFSVSWKVPAGQPSNAKYFLQFNGGTFIVSADTIVASQVTPGPLLGFKTSSTILCFDQSSWLGTNSGTDIGIQVFTCGSNSAPCPTAQNIGLWSQDQGSVPVKQSAPANKNGCN